MKYSPWGGFFSIFYFNFFMKAMRSRCSRSLTAGEFFVNVFFFSNRLQKAPGVCVQLPGTLLFTLSEPQFRFGDKLLNPFRTAVPFWGQTTQISSSSCPKRDCGSKGVIHIDWIVPKRRLPF